MINQVSLAALLLTAFCSGRIASAAFGVSQITDVVKDEGFESLVGWMKEHDGLIDSRIDIGTINGIRGIVATDDIEDGAQLMFCPWNLMFGSNKPMQSSDMCKVVEDMADEYRLGAESMWYPYLSHIQLPRLPAMWDQAAIDELQGIEPSQDAKKHIRWFNAACKGPLDDAAMKSLVAFVSRANEYGMTPIYDLLNHHNGRTNAKLRVVQNETQDGVELFVVDGPIRKGDQLYLSYGIKATSNMYRDYGFVEDWPTAWNFRTKAGDNFAFVMFPGGVSAINPTPDLLKTIWRSHLSLVDYQALAERHTNTLSFNDLNQFVVSGQAHLDGFPTSLQEDEAILKKKRLELEEVGLTQSDRSIIEDSISAIEYRSAFKRALHGALVYAVATGKSLEQSGTPRSQEL